MSLIDEYNKAAMTPGHSLVVFCRVMAIALDELAETIGKRPDADTAPVILPDDTRSWKRAFDQANGNGDVLNRLRHMSEVIDRLNEWANGRPSHAPLSVAERMAKARAARKRAT